MIQECFSAIILPQTATKMEINIKDKILKTDFVSLFVIFEKGIYLNTGKVLDILRYNEQSVLKLTKAV